MAWVEPFVYFGTADFSKRILAGLLAADCSPSLVVTTVAKPAGRGLRSGSTPVALLADQVGLPLVTVKSLKHGLPEELLNTPAVFGLLAAFGRILPPELLELYPRGIINVHPSLLPLYRGSAPMQYALLDGVRLTGVTVIRLDEAVDHGPILAQESIEVDDYDAPQLETKLGDLAVGMLLKAVPEYLSGRLSPVPQEHEQATFTKQISREDGQADFSLPAAVLNNKRRAFTPWPGLWTTWQGQRLKLIKTDIMDQADIGVGTIALLNGNLVIGCGQNSALIIKTLQLAGAKTQDSNSFINGHRDFISGRLPS